MKKFRKIVSILYIISMVLILPLSSVVQINMHSHNHGANDVHTEVVSSNYHVHTEDCGENHLHIEQTSTAINDNNNTIEEPVPVLSSHFFFKSSGTRFAYHTFIESPSKTIFY